MDFNFSPEDEAFRKELRAWLDVNAPKGMENSDSFGDEADDTNEWKRRIAWYKKLHQGGWSGSIGLNSSAGAARRFCRPSSIIRNSRARRRPYPSSVKAPRWLRLL